MWWSAGSETSDSVLSSMGAAEAKAVKIGPLGCLGRFGWLGSLGCCGSFGLFGSLGILGCFHLDRFVPLPGRKTPWKRHKGTTQLSRRFLPNADDNNAGLTVGVVIRYGDPDLIVPR